MPPTPSPSIFGSFFEFWVNQIVAALSVIEVPLLRVGSIQHLTGGAGITIGDAGTTLEMDGIVKETITFDQGNNAGTSVRLVEVESRNGFGGIPGTALTLASGRGQHSDDVVPGAIAGALNLTARPGGNGAPTQLSGGGGTVNVLAGDAGVDGGVGVANGGNVLVRAGDPSGTVTVRAGAGRPDDGVQGAADGGAVSIIAGNGGAGGAATPGKKGARVFIAAGAGGVDNGGGSDNGGDIVLAPGVKGTGALDGKVQFSGAFNEQATVGAVGGAAPLPATPVKYIKVKDDAGTVYVIPLYNP
jgi:hypothetical protein